MFKSVDYPTGFKLTKCLYVYIYQIGYSEKFFIAFHGKLGNFL